MGLEKGEPRLLLLLSPRSQGYHLPGRGQNSPYQQSVLHSREAETVGKGREKARGITRRRCSLIYLEHFSLTGLLVGVRLTALLSVVLALPLTSP